MADRKGFLIDESNHNTEGPMVFEMGKGFDSRPDPLSSSYEVSNKMAVVVAVLDMRRNPAWIHSQLSEREK